MGIHRLLPETPHLSQRALPFSSCASNHYTPPHALHTSLIFIPSQYYVLHSRSSIGPVPETDMKTVSPLTCERKDINW